MGVKAGVDPKRLHEAGWGVMYVDGADPAIGDALAPLLAHRQGQAGERFRIYSNDKGFRRPDDTKNKFLARHGMGPGPADPERVPYYLLIVGSPAAIPFKFQYELDVQYAVGRIDFATPEEYRRYAESVVSAETRAPKGESDVALFCPSHDPYTNLLSDQFIKPLAATLASYVREDIVHINGVAATRAALAKLLLQEHAPRLLITAGHGMAFDPDDRRQPSHQGALLCADWPGPLKWRGAIPPDFYFSADDLSPEMHLRGMIAFFLASYSAGTPEHDDFAREDFKQRLPVAPSPFSAALPQRMLSGGALAVVGQIERAWSPSLHSPDAGQQLATFQSTLRHLLAGHPIGSALEWMNERYVELSAMLSNELDDIKFGKRHDPHELADLWAATQEARNLILIGDPAVRLPAP